MHEFIHYSSKNKDWYFAYNVDIVLYLDTSVAKEAVEDENF